MIREPILFRPFFSLLLLLSFSPFCTYEPTSQIHPRNEGGGDKYENLVLVLEPVHVLIHATDENTIRSYLSILKLDVRQLAKLNRLRTVAKRNPIDLESLNSKMNSHNGMTKETKKAV